MSLSVYLTEGDECVFSANITHNLNKMAEEAMIYQHLWRPEELNITKADELIAPLTLGLSKLACNKGYYEKFNAGNGWGLWNNLVMFVAEYLEACKQHPKASVEACR